MASKAFFDPIVLLRAAPLVTSTSALWFSLDQYTFLNNFLRPEHHEKANELVPSYFKTFFPGGAAHIFLLYGISISTGAANFWGKPNGAWRWYAAGTALAATHFAFVPKIMWVIQSLCEDQYKGQGNRELKKWLNIHVIRSVIADLPAWICFGAAALTSLQAI
ncbi:hypothetical protein SCUP234_08740 [Seiridium cupressi]